MESPLALPLIFFYSPSIRLFLVQGVIHLGAVVCLWPTLLPLWLKPLLALCILALLVRQGREFLRLRDRPLHLMLNREEEWLLLQQGMDDERLQLLPGAFVHPWLAVLRFRRAGRLWPLVLILTRDNIESELFRRLRVRLRHPMGEGDI